MMWISSATHCRVSSILYLALEFTSPVPQAWTRTSLCASRICLILAKTRMIWMFAIARSLFRTLESIATPCSVSILSCSPQLKFAAGEVEHKVFREAIRISLPALFRFPVVTPYSSARSRSSIILICRMRCILLITISSVTIKSQYLYNWKNSRWWIDLAFKPLCTFPD